MTDLSVPAHRHRTDHPAERTSAALHGIAFAATLLTCASGAAFWLASANADHSLPIAAAQRPLTGSHPIATTTILRPPAIQRQSLAVVAQSTRSPGITSDEPSGPAVVSRRNSHAEAVKIAQTDSKVEVSSQPSTGSASVKDMKSDAVVPTLSQSSPDPCTINMSDDEQKSGVAVVMADVGPDAALISITRDEIKVHGRIDPAYLPMRRVLAYAGRNHLIAAIPNGMNPKIGDRIALQGSYRSHNGSCKWVPVMATDDFGPAPFSTTLSPKPNP